MDTLYVKYILPVTTDIYYGYLWNYENLSLFLSFELYFLYVQLEKEIYLEKCHKMLERMLTANENLLNKTCKSFPDIYSQKHPFRILVGSELR